jgi:hypothetical protein
MVDLLPKESDPCSIPHVGILEGVGRLTKVLYIEVLHGANVNLQLRKGTCSLDVMEVLLDLHCERYFQS